MTATRLATACCPAIAALALASASCKREQPLPAQTAAPIPQGGAVQAAPAPMPPPSGGAMQAPPPGAMPPAQPAMGSGSLELQRRIAAAEQVVAQDPKNAQAWVQLGNDYFDTQQRQKAVDAYAKALELKPGDPNVLTDQGVMYRELGQYDRAVVNFEKAHQADPTHMQSLYNLGVVQGFDLHQPEKAIQTWNRVIEKNPMSPQAAQARQAIDELRRRGTAPGGK